MTLFIVMAMATVTLTGCGGGSGSPTSATTQATNSATTTVTIQPYIIMDGLYAGTGVRNGNTLNLVAASVNALYQGYLLPNSNYVVFYSSPAQGVLGAMTGVSYGASGAITTQFGEYQEGTGIQSMISPGAINGGSLQGNYVADQYFSFNTYYKSPNYNLNINNASLTYVSGTNQNPSLSALAGNYNFTVGPTQSTAAYYGSFTIDAQGNLSNVSSTESAAATGTGTTLSSSNCGITASLTAGGSAAYNVTWTQTTFPAGCPAVSSLNNNSIVGYAVMPNATTLYLLVDNITSNNGFLVLQATKI